MEAEVGSVNWARIQDGLEPIDVGDSALQEWYDVEMVIFKDRWMPRTIRDKIESIQQSQFSV